MASETRDEILAFAISLGFTTIIAVTIDWSMLLGFITGVFVALMAAAGHEE